MTEQVDKSSTTVVKIFGREYPLKCDDNADRIQRVAEIVDAKMRAISRTTSLTSHSDIAVIAALNLTHELLGSQAGDDSSFVSSDEFSTRAESILSKLEESLPDLEPALGG